MGVYHEVDVAAPVARLHVGESVPLRGQRAQRLGEKFELLHRHRELAGARAHELPGDADEVADVEVAKDGEALPERVRARVELDGAGAAAEVGEAGLAGVAE